MLLYRNRIIKKIISNKLNKTVCNKIDRYIIITKLICHQSSII